MTKVHNAALFARLFSRKDEQVRVQNIVNRDVEHALFALGDSTDKGAREAGVAAAVIAAVELGRVVLAGSGKKVKDILRVVSV